MSMGASELMSRVNVDGVVGDIPLDLCWEVLESSALGRLAVVHDGKIHIFPINFAVDGNKIYFRTAAGSKVLAVKANDQVALEVDAFDETSAYTVVVKGRAAVVESPEEVATADALALSPWIPTLKLRWVRIWPSEVTGRAFRRGAEPEAYV